MLFDTIRNLGIVEVMKLNSDISSSEAPGSVTEPSLIITQLGSLKLTQLADGKVEARSALPSILLLLEGSAKMLPGAQILTANDVVLIPAGYTIQLAPSMSGARLRCAGVEFSFNIDNFDATNLLPESLVKFNQSKRTELRRHICAICNEIGTDGGISKSAAFLAAGYNILSLISDEISQDTQTPFGQHQDPDLKRLMLFLQDNYRYPIVAEDIASACNMSIRQLFRESTRLTGKTPMKLLKSIRLKRSIELLKSSDLRIEEVARSVGFGCSKSFSRDFKKWSGMSAMQFRRLEKLSTATATLIENAERQLNDHHYRAAGQTYMEAVDSAPEWRRVDELRYKAGQALFQAGDVSGAAKVWSDITALNFQLKVKLLQCKQTRMVQHYQLILDRFQDIADYGDTALRSEMADLLGNYMLQAALVGKHLAAKKYCEFARELTSDFPFLQSSLARTLYTTGQYAKVELDCPQQDFYVAASLRASGKFTEHLERFPDFREQNAILHLLRADWEVLIKDFPGKPHYCASALCAAGEYNKAIKDYPNHCLAALLCTKRYDEALACFPDKDIAAWALAFQGKVDEVLKWPFKDGTIRSQILLYLGLAINVISDHRTDPEFLKVAKCMYMLDLIEQGHTDLALTEMEQVAPITDPAYFYSEGFYLGDLLIPAMRYLLQNSTVQHRASRWPSCSDYYREINENHKFTHMQMLWYDVRMVLNLVDDEEFLQQPNRVPAPVRLWLLKGLQADIAGDGPTASKHYRCFVEAVTCNQYLYLRDHCHIPLSTKFASWRLSVL